jgi:SAM-dependent methyltransferase
LFLKRLFGKEPTPAPSFPGTAADPLAPLKQKWHEVPIEMDPELPDQRHRISTRTLLEKSDEELIALWTRTRDNDLGNLFAARGWYKLLYRDGFRGKNVMDVGSGLGTDGITFAQHGAKVTFVDVVESNLEVLRRVCRALAVPDVTFCYLDKLEALKALPTNYDVVWCAGSLLHAPYELICQERRLLLEHLPVGGRWMELAYPRARWEREGALPFDRWGGKTDGENTPWAEWYDLAKIRAALQPARFDVVLSLEFHNSDFIWFDLVRRS